MMLVDVWVGDPGSCPSFVYNLKMNGDDTGARGFFEGATHRLFATFGATFGHKLGTGTFGDSADHRRLKMTEST
jgi:hypothetical protein